MFSQLDYESALHNMSEELLRSVAGRFLDKKVLKFYLSCSQHLIDLCQASVRSEAFNSLGKLYSLASPEMYAQSPPQSLAISP